MSDVFISYSRLDKEFVGQLRELLIAREQDVWIDWESIPPSQAWWDEIQKGIVRANNFVVVLSPNSMASPICQMEIEYARQLKKRIIPVLYTDYDREKCLINITRRLAAHDQGVTRLIWGTRQPHDLFDANDAELKHINYFLFRADVDFEQRFDDLFAIIRTDFVHKEQHTTLELRALEWDRRGRDVSFLLLDKELEQAEIWLTAARNKMPAPTELHTAYIEASRRRTRQLRTIRRASVIGTIVAVGAVIFAVGASWIGASAVNSANVSLTSVAQQVQDGEKRIESLRLAALANHILQDEFSDPELAALLGIRALKKGYSPQADAALVQAIDRLYGRQIFAAHENGGINSVAFSLDGRYLLTGSADNTARLWDTRTGEELRQFVGHTSAIRSVALSSDGRYVLTGSGDEDKTARLWDAQTGEELRRFGGGSGWVLGVAFSPDGSSILTASVGRYTNTAQLLDAQTGELLHEFSGHTHNVLSVAFSPNGQYVLTGSRDRTARLWDASTGEELHQFVGHGTVQSVAFSPDGQYILTGSADRTARLWDANTKEEVRQFTGHVDELIGAVFSPDGQYILTGSADHTVRLWDARTGDELRQFTDHAAAVRCVSFYPDGRHIITGNSDGSVRLWNAWGEPRQFTNHAATVQSVAFSPDGRAVLTSTTESTVLWDAQTGGELRQLAGPTVVLHTVVISPDGRWMLAVSSNGRVELWDAETGERLHQFADEGLRGVVQSVAFSPDVRYMLVGRAPPYMETRLWDVATGEMLPQFADHNFVVNSAAFSPDGSFVLTANSDAIARLWDTQTGELRREFSGHTSFVWSVAFSPDGQYILTGGGDPFSGADSTARLWDAATGEELRQFIGHTFPINSVAFSPDGDTILTGSDDTTARLWDRWTGEEVRQFGGHTAKVNSVAFSPDGRTALTGSGDSFSPISDNTAWLWDTNYLDFVAYACHYVFRDFTTEERQRFGIPIDEPTCP